jgi:CheY-like chemotaxis protein
VSASLISKRVLVVEDELIVSWLLEDMLAGFGCVVVGPAARVAQALAMIGSEDIDAAVLDVSLDGEFSYPVANALMVRCVPFIFATGYDRARLPPVYRAYGALQKPFHGSELRRALSKLFPAVGHSPGPGQTRQGLA